MRASVVLAALAAVALASPAFGAPKDPVERKMVATIEAERARSLKLLEDLVRVNSGTMNLAGVEQVGRMLRPEFEQLGFEVRWIPMAKVGRAGHLVATHKGSGRGKRVLLIGHLDTVFEPDSPFQGWKRDGDIVEGPGVGDMKGGDVVMVAALRAMHAAGALKDADITVVLTGDEEKPGAPLAEARADLIAAAARVMWPWISKACLVLAAGTWAPSPAVPRPRGPFARRRNPATRPVSASRTRDVARSMSWRGSSTNSGASCRSRT